MEYHGAGSALESSGSVIVVAWDGVSEVDEEDYNFSGVAHYLKKPTKVWGGGGVLFVLGLGKKLLFPVTVRKKIW